MTHSLSENNWVGDDTDHLTGYDESWRLDDDDDDDEDFDNDDEDDLRDGLTEGEVNRRSSVEMDRAG